MVLLPTKPTILLVTSAVRESDPQTFQRINSRFTIVNYDCESVAEFCERLQPGGPYSNIDAIVRTGWLKAEPFSDQFIFTKEVVKFYPESLKIVVCSGHGYDQVDLDALTRMGIWYCNTPNTCTTAVANTALYLILDTFRLFTSAAHSARTCWSTSHALGHTATEPSGQILGVIGLGAIGLAIAQKAAAGLDMVIHYHNRRRNQEAEGRIPGGAVYHGSLESLLRVADCVVLAAPYSPETHHMLSGPQFELAKESGMRVVNIARGKMVDEGALIEAMKRGKVVGVGLDVHEKEPGVNEAFMEDYAVTVLPHIGVCSRTSWANFEKVCWENIEGFFLGEGPVTPVNWVEGRVMEQ